VESFRNDEQSHHTPVSLISVTRLEKLTRRMSHSAPRATG